MAQTAAQTISRASSHLLILHKYSILDFRKEADIYVDIKLIATLTQGFNLLVNNLHMITLGLELQIKYSRFGTVNKYEQRTLLHFTTRDFICKQQCL